MRAPPAGGCRGRPRHEADIALRVPDELGLPRKDTGRDGFGDGIPASASQREGVAAIVARRVAKRMLREDRDGTASVVQVEDRHPVVGDHSLELPRETLEEPARVELGRHRAGPRRDGPDDTAQVDLSFRHAVIIRPHPKSCRDRLRPCRL